MARTTLFVLVACCDLADRGKAAAPSTWPAGNIPVLAIDPSLEQNVTAVLDELEQKTFLHFLRSAETDRGLHFREERAARAEGTELCCFDPASENLQRELAKAVLRAVGVAPVESAGSEPGAAVASSEAEDVNRLYASEVLPAAGALPVRLEVGVKQLSKSKAWPDLLGGRGRRVIAGAMLWAKSLASSGKLPGLVGALPTFVFHGNKAEVVLLGPESAKLVPGRNLPPEQPSEGLGAGIRRVTLHARRAGQRGIAAGVPTYLGDSSALFLRSAFAEVDYLSNTGQQESLLQERRSALAWSESSRQAESRGALLGLPTFVEEEDADFTKPGRMEIVLLYGRSPRPGLKSEGDGTAGDTPWIAILAAVSVLSVAGFFLTRRQKRGRHSTISSSDRAEREFAHLVDSL